MSYFSGLLYSFVAFLFIGAGFFMSFIMHDFFNRLNSKSFFLCLVLLFNISCSEQTEDKATSIVQQQKVPENKKPEVEIIIDPLPTKQIRGDYQHVSFIIENAAKQKFAGGILECRAQNIDSDATQEIICTSMQKIDHLQSGTYRLLLKSATGYGLTCEIFEYKAGVPLHVVLNEETSGSCLLWQIIAETGYSEQEIRERVAYILNSEGTKKYNLEATLFDLYMYFGGKTEHENAWNKLLDLIKSNKPLPRNNNSTINSSLRML